MVPYNELSAHTGFGLGPAGCDVEASRRYWKVGRRSSYISLHLVYSNSLPTTPPQPRPPRSI